MCRRDLSVKPASPATLHGMEPLIARLRNERLVLDEPTDLSEGTVVELVPLDEVLARGGAWLDDEERARLHEELRERAWIKRTRASSLMRSLFFARCVNASERARESEAWVGASDGGVAT